MSFDGVRILKDVELDNIYIIGKFDETIDTSFGFIERQEDGNWTLQLLFVPFVVELNAEEILKILEFICDLNEQNNLSKNSSQEKESSNFPDWDQAPSWATFTAMDDDGNWYWFETRPTFDTFLDEWDPANQTRYEYMGYNHIFRHAHNSLLHKSQTTIGDTWYA